MLGVAPGATPTQINAAYRRALRRLHPDTSPHTGQGDGGTTTPGRVSDPAPELTLAELQQARRDLLSAASPAGGSRHAPPDPCGPHDARAPDERARQIRVRAARDRGPRVVPVRGYRPAAGRPDILAGPVRHQPPPPPG